LYRSLTARNQHISDETAEQRASRIAKADLEYRDAAATLSQMMLGPVAAQLGHKRLVIIGAPWTAFEALPSPRRDTGKIETAIDRSVPESRNTPASSFRPLIADHEIVRVPSASVLAALRREATTRQSFASGVAIIADPVFARDDPRVKIREAASPGNSSPTSRRSSSAAAIPAATIDSKGTLFRRLRFSREEADAISSMASRSKTFEAVDFAANKDVLNRESFSQRSIIHFATHTVLNDERPDLSGIVLSLVDDYGNPLDGVLRLHEIYNLRLSSSLVVLSACNSANGSGGAQNLVGLTTGFMYAGASRVVASLWSVDDRATAELMKRFYKAMLVDGLRPAAALRTAQLQMLGEKGWSAPYFWAAFTLQGEWR
jgi:CHAT domain-containing protein